jgi:hypothetical protein
MLDRFRGSGELGSRAFERKHGIGLVIFGMWETAVVSAKLYGLMLLDYSGLLLPKVFVHHIADLAREAEKAGGGHLEVVKIMRVL